MLDRLEISVLPRGRRYAAHLRFRLNGEDLLVTASLAGGRGPWATDALPPGGPSPLRATDEPRRVELGEPECTGGCCGCLTVVVQRLGDIVQWSDWEQPVEPPGAPAPAPLPAFRFDAAQYDAAWARAEADRSWQPQP